MHPFLNNLRDIMEHNQDILSIRYFIILTNHTIVPRNDMFDA